MLYDVMLTLWRIASLCQLPPERPEADTWRVVCSTHRASSSTTPLGEKYPMTNLITPFRIFFFFFFGFLLTKENNRSLKLFKKADFKLMSIEIRNLNSFYSLYWITRKTKSKEKDGLKQMSRVCFYSALFFSISACRCVTLQ